MRFTVRKLYFAWDFEKEEKWLNEMASKGMNLQGVGFCKYDFEEGTPGEYQYHLEWLRNMPGNPESISYIRFIEETGAEHVGSFKKWAYFRKKRSEGAFDLFSDLDSRITHFGRILRLTSVLLVFILAYLAYVIWLCTQHQGIIVSFLPMFALYGVLLGCLTVGLVKTYRAYKKLRKERIMRE